MSRLLTVEIRTREFAGKQARQGDRQWARQEILLAQDWIRSSDAHWLDRQIGRRFPDAWHVSNRDSDVWEIPAENYREADTLLTATTYWTLPRFPEPDDRHSVIAMTVTID